MVGASGLRVLVVDDEPADRAMLNALLEQAGVHIDGSYAELNQLLVALRHGQHPDLVVADLNLPDSRGVDTIQVLRAAHPELPVVAVTGDVDAATMSLAAGADEVVTKDRLAEQLHSAVTACMQRHAGPVGAKISAFFLAESALVVVDSLDRIVLSNEAAHQLLQHTPRGDEEFSLLFTPEDRLEVVAFLLSARQAAGGRVWCTARLQDPAQGHEVHLTGRTEARSGRVHVTISPQT